MSVSVCVRVCVSVCVSYCSSQLVCLSVSVCANSNSTQTTGRIFVKLFRALLGHLTACPCERFCSDRAAMGVVLSVGVV